MSNNCKSNENKAQVEEFLKNNMPSIKEIAPQEYEKLMELREIIGNKYTEKASSLLKEKGLSEGDVRVAGCAFVAGAALAGAGVIGKEVYDKATGN